MKLPVKLSGIVTLLFVLATASCNSTSNGRNYQVPEQTTDGLQVASMEQLGFNTSLITDVVDRIERGKYGEVHSILIYKDDKLVLEEYFPGHTYQWDAPGHKGEWVAWDSEMQHCIQSDTKSITSLCIGIAMDKGFIESVNQSIFDYLPDYQHLNINNKEYITIEHLLTMTSGLQWEEWAISLSSVENDQIAIFFSDVGPINYVLGSDFAAVPGTRFNYSGGDIQILVEILENATGMQLDEFSEKYLFEPLGITSFDWWLKFPSGGQIQGAGGLKLTPRDMVKVGAMMLNKGKWNGQRIVSEEWVSKCATPYAGNTGIKVPGEDLGNVGYAYTWWTKQSGKYGEMFFALGWGGQKIMVIPDLNAVVVFTGANFQRKVKQYKILDKYILPAIE
ncbi:serine hydrolase domain-containing protein [Maribellus mangrovi]|uniref:serine hydrolase domain-containing protein n=1 Tax=Maribellus mangrovi TaxID=3133146 RepID=UPI0030EF666A